MGRIDAYFKDRQLSRHADRTMVVKTVLGVAAWLVTYAGLLARRSTAGIVGAYVLHGLAQLYMAFNIAHDANHDAYSRSRRMNRTMGRVFDLVGVSSYVWRLMHNDSHHSFINIHGADSTLLSGGLFRYSPHEPRRRVHRYQHLYALLLYCLPTLDWVLTKDFRWLASVHRFGNRVIVKHPRRELVLLLGFKAFYYAYMLLIPILVLPAAWWSVLVGFIVMHCVLGLAISMVFQPNHFVDGSAFPEADESGQISIDYLRHVLATTADYARGNPFARWMLGGLNLHVIHHMFPGTCHTHYAALTEILRETAREHGLAYREVDTMGGAFLRHLRWLRALGRTDGPPTGGPPVLAP